MNLTDRDKDRGELLRPRCKLVLFAEVIDIFGNDTTKAVEVRV